MSRTPNPDPAQPGTSPELSPTRPHDPIEPDPADTEPQPAPARESEIPPYANPANWVDHED